MALVSSLLTAIVRADGDALVMHVGEKPYVVTHAGNVELSSQGLNLEAMSGMLTQLLPPDAMRSLADFGAVEHELLPRQAMQGDRFTVVAARGGDDIWIEIRRHRVPRVVEAVPVATVEPAFARVQMEASIDAAPAPPARVQVEASHDAAPPPPARVQLEATTDAATLPAARVQVEASHDAAPPPLAPVQVEASHDAAPAPPARVQVEASHDAAPPPPARVHMEATHDVALPGSTSTVAVAAPPLPSPALVEAQPVPRVLPEPVLSEARPPDVRVELPPSEAKPSEGLPSDARPSEGLPSIVRPSEALPSHERPSEGLPSEAKPTEGPPNDARPGDGLPSDATPKVAATPIVAAHAEAEATAVATSPKVEHVEPRVESAPPAAARPVRSAVLTEHVPSDPRPSEVASARQASGHSSDEIPSAAPHTEPQASLGEALPVETPPAFARPEAAASDGVTSPEASVGGEGGPVLVAMPRTMRIAPPRSMSARPGGVERLLALASSRGASVLCLTSQSRPHVRADGEIHVLEGEARLAAADVEAAVLELTPEGERDALRRGEPTEWVSEFEGIGLIRCTTFRDYRGPGAFFHLISARQNLADQLGLARSIQALATASDGLVIVAAPRGGGKSTLVSAFVDLINRQQSAYIVALERQIRIVHDNRHSLISQREVRGAAADVVSAARGALRENPDVLVLEDAGSAEVMQLALDAAGSGLLVFVSVTAPSTIGAIVRMLDWFPPERRPAVQAALAERLRGAVAQVMLWKTGGGRVAARELLLTTTAVATVLAEGQIAQLALAMDSGRKHGMVALNDALLALVQSGTVDVREAYRKADNQDALLNLLKREGVDTSFVERLA